MVDFTDVAELMFIKIQSCTDPDMTELFRISDVYHVKIIDYSPSSVLLERVKTEEKNDELIRLLEQRFTNKLEIIRGGSVAVDAIIM